MQDVIQNPTAVTPYEPPMIVELGGVSEHTLNGCYWGKQFGGTDGFTFMGINVPISSCSS